MSDNEDVDDGGRQTYDDDDDGDCDGGRQTYDDDFDDVDDGGRQTYWQIIKTALGGFRQHGKKSTSLQFPTDLFEGDRISLNSLWCVFEGARISLNSFWCVFEAVLDFQFLHSFIYSVAKSCPSVIFTKKLILKKDISTADFLYDNDNENMAIFYLVASAQQAWHYNQNGSHLWEQ